jgi:hypothetical protein
LKKIKKEFIVTYEAEISRANPTAIIFVIDQSYSMGDPLGGSSGTKSNGLATVVNKLLNDLVIRCSKGDEVFDYFEVGMIGYGNDAFGPTKVGSAFGGSLQGRDIVPVSQIADYPMRIEKRKRKVDDGAGGLVEIDIDFPVWLEPTFSSNTPMMEAMSYTFNLVSDWVAQHPASFPPIVIHVTDGEPTDGDPRPLAEAVRGLATNDGNVLMFSLHLSKENLSPIIFPNTAASLPNVYAQLLHEMSSELPDKWLGMAAETMSMNITRGARAFVFNSDLATMVRFLEIGTRQPAPIKN